MGEGERRAGGHGTQHIELRNICVRGKEDVGLVASMGVRGVLISASSRGRDEKKFLLLRRLGKRDTFQRG